MDNTERQQIVDKAMEDTAYYLRREAVTALVILNTSTSPDGSKEFPDGYLVQCARDGKPVVLDMLKRLMPMPMQGPDKGKPSIESLTEAKASGSV